MLAYELMVSSEELHRRGQLEKALARRLMGEIRFTFVELCPPGTDSTSWRDSIYWRLRPITAYIDRLDALK